MKHTFKKVAAILSVVAMLTSVLAVNASAALPIITKKPTTQASGVVESTTGSSGTSYTGLIRPPKQETTAAPAEESVIEGGVYYASADKELQKYFASNCYSFSMKVGEARVLASDAVFYSVDSSIVSFNAETGALEAKAEGKTTVYAYTKSGLPFLKLTVTVTKAPTVSSLITIRPNNWFLSAIGANTDFSIKCPEKYKDLVYEIVFGKDKAYFSGAKLIAKAFGPVVVRVYSKSCPTIWGETIVYVGKYDAPVYDGYWYTSGSNICVNKAPVNIWNGCYYHNIKGWIKSMEGVLIPVIRVEEVVVNRGDGKQDTTIAVGSGSLTMSELFTSIYCDKDLIKIFGWDGDLYPVIIDKEVAGVVLPTTKPVFKPGCTTPDWKPDYKPDFKPDFKPDYKPDWKPDYKPGHYPVCKPQAPKPSVPNDHPFANGDVTIEDLRDYFEQLKDSGTKA